MRWQYGERAALVSRADDRQALIDAGMSPEAADAALPDEREPEVFELMAEGLPVWRVWQGMQTQWRAGPAGVLGLDYAALPVVERALGVELGAERFEWLLGMEFEALRCLSKKRG